MPDYARFARFYDEVMDDPAPRGARVLDWITRYRPEAQRLLELGCGTGAILAQLTSVPSLTGLDRSPEMLAVASQRVPSARLLQGDMASFALGERFDVVVCVFDSLNHLLAFEQWQSLFRSVHDHLVDGGLFLFDVNTIGELRRLGEEPPWVYDFGTNLLVLDVSFEEDGRSLWDIRIFECLGGSRYELHHERIGELGVPLDRIRSALAPAFALLEETDEHGGAPSEESVKAHFAFRRRP
ncbi:MAG: class I SAM-dependent DNA methyltransferase [Acidimicrobiales bacterium]